MAKFVNKKAGQQPAASVSFSKAVPHSPKTKRKVLAFLGLALLVCLCAHHVAATLSPTQIEEPQTTKTDRLDTARVFEVELQSLEYLTQHSPFVAVLLHQNGTAIPENIEKNFSILAQSIADERKSNLETGQVLFCTAGVSQDNKGFLRELLSLPKNSEYLMIRDVMLVIFAKQRPLISSSTGEALNDQQAMRDFIVQNTDRRLLEINDEQSLTSFLNKKSKRVLLGTSNSTLIDAFRNMESRNDVLSYNGRIEVALIQDSALLEMIPGLSTTSSFPTLAFLNEQSEVTVFSAGDMNVEAEVKEFVQTQALDILYEYSAANYMEIFGSPIPNQIHLFIDPSSDNSAILETFKAAAIFNKNEELAYDRMVFVVHPFSEETVGFMELFDIVDRKEQLPMIAMTHLDYSRFGFVKYIMESSAVAADVPSIITFGEQARSKNISPHYRSEAEEEEVSPQPLLKKIVGSNFKQRVLKTPLSYFILYHDSKDSAVTKPYEDFLQQFLQEVPREEFESLLSFATFDLNKNEMEYLNINAAPTLVVYPHLYKHNPQAYKGPLNVSAVSKFLNQWVRGLSIGKSGEGEVKATPVKKEEVEKKPARILEL